MILHEHKLIFIHINKTGGSSIEKVFNYEGIKHERPDQLKELIGEDKWEDYFKFTIVRNPWDRLVSEFFYRKKKGSVSSDFKEWLFSMSRMKNTVSAGPQINWIGEEMDYVGRFEDFQVSFDYVCNKVGLGKIILPHTNATSHDHYSKYYDGESRDLVAEWHKEDLDAFDYEFEDAHA